MRGKYIIGFGVLAISAVLAGTQGGISLGKASYTQRSSRNILYNKSM